MGQSTSTDGAFSSSNNTTNATGTTVKSQNIQHLISYARDHYQNNPTESLAALLQAMTLNSGPQAATHAMDRLRNELGDDIADHIGSHTERTDRAMAILQELLEDESTELFRQGRQDILRQTMEDGSSVVCSRCYAVVASTRWQQHQELWCSANDTDNEGGAVMSDDMAMNNAGDAMDTAPI